MTSLTNLPTASLSRAPSSKAGDLGLLLATGITLGTVFPLGKLAASVSIDALAWPASMMLGGGVILAVMAMLKRQPLPTSARHLGYYAVAGLLTMTIPNILLFTVMPHLGAGLSAIFYTLPPLLTLLLSVGLGVEHNTMKRSVGIGLGFAGALTIVAPSGMYGSGDLIGWLLLALLIPVAIAAGNVYRTKAWPAGSSPLALSAGTMLAAAIWLLAASAITGRLDGLATLGNAPLLVAVQAVLFGAQFLMFMRLQRTSGPVFVSQVGYIAPVVGLLSGLLLFAERYSAVVMLGAILIAAGVIIGNHRKIAN
ncbi:DMT family transporter [Tabrizicola sp. BL-A-41-H6]|uniref:DMT family transporter n=1 Tax=Tabrizicola sp. BL-A-41-H6 TaxID=3421107 RepID=UPI003D66600C